MRKKQTQEQQLLEQLCPKPSFILDVENRLQKDELLGINIGSLEGRFLQWLISSHSVEKVVEIGTQYGCSTLWMAQAMGAGGKIYTLEKNPKHIEEAKRSFSEPSALKLGCDIELIEGDAAESLKSIEDRAPFDLVFIDANKSKYLEYYYWSREFLKKGGLLVADNVYLFGTMFQEAAPEGMSEKVWSKMKSFLEELFADPSFVTSFVPTAEGLLVATKK